MNGSLSAHHAAPSAPTYNDLSAEVGDLKHSLRLGLDREAALRRRLTLLEKDNGYLRSEWMPRAAIEAVIEADRCACRHAERCAKAVARTDDGSRAGEIVTLVETGATE